MSIPEGYVALDFVGFTDKGEYSSTETYMQNDLARYENAVWRCLTDNTAGVTPAEGERWTTFVLSPKKMEAQEAVDTHGLLGAEGGTVNAQELLDQMEAPTFEDWASEGAQAPDARTAIAGLLSGIKLPAFLSKAKAALMGLVTLGEMRELLVNNGMCTEAGKYFLDAAMGKTLKDGIDDLNSNKLNISALNFSFATINLTYGSSPDWHKLSVMKRGNYGILAGIIILPADSAWTDHTIFTLPSGYHPAHRIDIELINRNGVFCMLSPGNNFETMTVRYGENVMSEQEFWINIPFLIA